MKTYSIYILLCVAFLFTGCDEPVDPDQDEKDNLSATWIIQKVIIDGEEDTNSDYSPFQVTFNADKTYSRANASGATDNGTWELKENATVFVLNGNEQFNIISLSATGLSYSFTFESDKLGSFN